MQAGTYDPDADVLEPIVRVVFIDGVRVDDAWLIGTTLDAELVTHLPAQMGTGMSARNGTVTIGPRHDVGVLPPSPLRRDGIWPPRKGQSITITDTTATQQWRRATAVVTSVRAGLGEHDVVVEWRDDKDPLDQATTLPPVAARMPGSEVSESGVLKRYWQRTGIEPWGIAVEAFEDAGYRLLPSPAAGTGNVSLYSLFQGSAYPRVGYIQQTYSAGDLLTWDASGFQYLAQWSYFTPGFTGRDPGEDLQVFLRTTDSGPSAQLRFTVSGTEEIRVVLSGASNSVQIIYYRTDTSTSTVLLQRGFTTASPLPWLGISFGPDVMQVWTADDVITQVFYTDAGGPATIPLEWTRVRVYAAAALMVKFGTRAGWADFNWPSLRIRSAGPWLVREPTCTRTIEARGVGDILADISEAAVVSFWHDEYGIANMIPTSLLTSAAPVATITTRRDVLAGEWEESGTGVHSSIVARYEDGALTASSLVRVVLEDATSGRTLSAGDVVEDWVGPGVDEEWISPDMTPLPASQNAETSYVEARFSVWGGCYVSDEGTSPETSAYSWADNVNGSGYLSIAVSNVTPRQWKVTHTMATTAQDTTMETIPNGASIPLLWRGKALPIWRGRGKVSFVDAQVTVTGGPAWAPILEHELGAWGSRADAQRVADYLASMSQDVTVVLEGLEVWMDPRRQLGDVVTVPAPHELGGTITALVSGIHEATDRDVEPVQLLDLIVLTQAPDVSRTYGVLEDSASTYGVLEDAHTTYQDMEDG